MKFCLFLFILTACSYNVFACLSASQNRIFPLGVTNDGLCVVETHMNRTHYRDSTIKADDWEAGWVGFSYFKIYDSNYKVIESKCIDTFRLFKGELHDSLLQLSFLKGLAYAKMQHDFIIATPEAITFCDFQIRCSKAKLLFSFAKNNVSILLPNNKKYPIPFLNDTLAISNSFIGFEKYDDAAFVAADFERSMFVGSVRNFVINNRKLTVVHICSGSIVNLANGGKYPPGNNERTPNILFNSIEKSVIDEPLLHHGTGFDVFIWE
jgi:hypothetical protein